jgi:hypothetical protein
VSSLVTTSTVAGVTSIAAAPGLARLLALAVLLALLALLLAREVSQSAGAPGARRWQAGLVIGLAPLAGVALLSAAVSGATINRYTPAASAAQERYLVARQRIRTDPMAAIYRVELGDPTARPSSAPPRP